MISYQITTRGGGKLLIIGIIGVKRPSSKTRTEEGELSVQSHKDKLWEWEKCGAAEIRDRG